MAYRRLRFLESDGESNPIRKVVKGLNEGDVQRSKDKNKQTANTKQGKRKHMQAIHPASLGRRLNREL
jgi:hypothetical protein